MINVYGGLYYIDFDELDEFLLVKSNEYPNGIKTTKETVKRYDVNNLVYNTEEIEKEHIVHKEINGVKYDLISRFVEDLSLSSDEMGETDPKLGSRNLEKASNRFKLAFNTLVYYNILKKID